MRSRAPAAKERVTSTPRLEAPGLIAWRRADGAGGCVAYDALLTALMRTVKPGIVPLSTCGTARG